MKFSLANILLLTPLSSAWHVYLYKNKDYDIKIVSHTGTASHACANFGSTSNDKASSVEWYSNTCVLGLYQFTGCTGAALYFEGDGEVDVDNLKDVGFNDRATSWAVYC